MAEVHQAGGLTLVALPYVSKDGFSGPTVRSLLNGFASGKFGNVQFLFIGDKTQVAARNDACRAAIESGAEYLWFIDSDQDFDPEMLNRLKAVDADVACPDMWARCWPSFRIVFRPTPPDESGKVRHISIPDDEANGIRDISFCGMGCTLIRTSTLREMAVRFQGQPWFWTAEHGEDATFCFKVLEMGGKVKCDFGAVSGHYGSIRMVGQPVTREAQ